MKHTARNYLRPSIRPVMTGLLLLPSSIGFAEDANAGAHLSSTTLTGQVRTQQILNLEASASYATHGILQRDGEWEVSTTFNIEMDAASVQAKTNYTMTGGGGIESLRFVPQTGAIILACTNLQAAGNGLTLQNLKDATGNLLPNLNFSVLPNETAWTEVGANELNLYADAVAVGENGFDLVSGGFQMWNLYDEATFAFREVTGNFDAIIRVEEQSPSSRWARAGLMVREFLDNGRPRPANPSDPDQGFCRYLDLHVNPVTRADGTPGNNTHEVSIRAYPGGIGRPPFEEPTVNPVLGANAAPEYPNAWLRVRRQGQNFTVYRGSNGTDWTEMGSFTFPSETHFGDPLPPLPATLYVGPVYSPENGNITDPILRTSFLARFRDFSVEASAAPARLAVSRSGDEVEVSWNEAGVLQTSQTLEPDSWTNLPGAASPYRFSPTSSPRFYRLKQE